MKWFTTDNGKYRIESLSSITLPGALKVIRDAFCQDEYLSKGTEVNKNPEAVEELQELCATTALDGVSVVAVEVDSGEVVSVAFNILQVQTPGASEKPFFEIFAEESCSQASSRALIQFMADVDTRCNFFGKFGVDCSLEIMFLATLREHRKQKLATIICQTSIEIARKIKDGPITSITVEDLGPKYSHLRPRNHDAKYPKFCQAIWTTAGSQKIGKLLNFTVDLTVPFSGYIHDGKTYAQRIGDDSAFCQVVSFLL